MDWAQYLSEQRDELVAQGYDARVDGDRIVVSLTVQQAIFLQGVTVNSGPPWPASDGRR